VQKFLRIFGIIAIIGLIIAAIVASMNQPKPTTAEMIWDEQTTVGNPNAKNHFIVYSDLVCPYCIAFENAVVEHEEDFKKYIEQNDILYEVRLSDFLYEFGETNPINSRYSAIATYCAKKEGKFWDYYNKAITTVWNDYFKSLGKSAVSKMASINKDYWINIGEQVDLGDDFKTCVRNDETLAEVQENAHKTSKLVHGMPYFKFNNYVSSGYDLSWGWEYVLMYFQQGLENK